MITLGTIQVDLIANTVSFSQGMDKAGQIAMNSAKNIQRSLNLITVEAAAMATAIIGAFGEMIKSSEDYAFAVSKAASATGTSTEMFSKLAYNAKLAGVPMDNLKMALERLGRTAGAAQSGNKDTASAYAALGISVKDLAGPLSNSGDLFVAVAKSLDKFKDSTNKTALEQKLLGRSGAELAPLISQVASGFDTAAQQATLFGVVIGDKTATQAKQLHQSLAELESVSLGLSLRLLSDVAPALQEVSQQILKVVTSAGGVQAISNIASDVASVVRGLGNAFLFLYNHATAVKVAIESLAAVKLASFFIPMIASAATAGNGIVKIGTAAFGLVARLSGISALSKVFTPLITGAASGVASLFNLTRAFGIAETAAYAYETALVAIESTAAVALGSMALLVLPIAAVGLALRNTLKDAQAMTGGAAGWTDIWSAGINQLIDKYRILHLEASRFTNILGGSLSAEDQETQKFIDKYGLLGKTFKQATVEATNARLAMTATNTAAPTPSGEGTKDAPTLPKVATEKIDIVQKKMMELRDAAEASQQALNDVGKGVDFERADTAAKESKKLIDELNMSLALKGDKLSLAEEAQIKADIATKVNNESETKYLDTLKKSTDQAIAKAQAQDILNAAIGKSAEVQRAAQLAADEVTRTAGQSEEWKNKHGVANATLGLTEQGVRDRNNQSNDTASLQSVQQQIDAQMRLNTAILQGKDAIDATTLSEQKAAINRDFDKRQDVSPGAREAALSDAQMLFDLKQKESDLNKAASMDPALQYREQVKGLNDAAQAARDAGFAISTMQLQAADKSAWDSYLASVDKATLAVGNMGDGVSTFFRHMSRDSQSAAQQMHDVFSTAFNDLNSMMEKLIAGQKINLSSMFRDMAGQIAKTGIQKAEGGIAGGLMKSLGLGDKKPDAQVAAVNKSNDLLAQIRDRLPMGGSGALGGASSNSLLGPIVGAASGSAGNTAMSALTPLLSAIPGGSLVSSVFGGLFGGHRALGGQVQAGVSYDVGEMGREKFTPNQNGTITPNNQLNGNTTMHIDARGSNDPAQTEAAIHRAFAVYSPHIVAASQHAASDHAKRGPSKGR